MVVTWWIVAVLPSEYIRDTLKCEPFSETACERSNPGLFCGDI